MQKLLDCLRSHFLSATKGRVVVMPAGTGKTYIMAKALKAIQDEGLLAPIGPYSFCNILLVTTAKAITQTQRVLIRGGVRDTLVTSHASMSRGFGNGLLSWVPMMRNGQLEELPIFNEDTKPKIIVVDESQAIKNEDSLLAIIVEAAIKQGILVVLMSATPYCRASDTTLTNLALGLIPSRDDNERFMGNFRVQDSSYTDYSPGTMRNYNQYLVDRDLKIEAHGIKFPHRVFNRCVLVDFESKQHKQIYSEAYENYLKELDAAGRLPPSDARVAQWVANQKFWQAAELIRSGSLVRAGMKILRETNKQIIIAVNYKDSFDQLYGILREVWQIPANRISQIRGGRNCQKDIDLFQYGKTDFCLLTLKAGGAGLSLHHEHKQARPRYGIIPPTHSAIQWVQLMGRAHRINSLSTTYQDCCWLRGTYEENVSLSVQHKIKSLQECVSRKETWLSMFMPKTSHDLKELEESLLKDTLEGMGSSSEDGQETLDSMPIEALTI